MKKSGVKSNIMLIVLGVSIISLLSGCKYITLEDVYKKQDDSYIISEGEENLNQKPTQDPNVQRETLMHEDPTFTVNDKDKIIHVVNFGDKINYCDYEFTVEDAWISEDLMFLDEIEGNSRFREFLMYKKAETLDEAGKFIGKRAGTKWLFLKMKLKNSIASNFYWDLDFYNGSGEGVNMKFTRMSTIESIGFDKYKYLDDRTQSRKDELQYYFKKGEEIETVVAFYLQGTATDLYLGTKFLFRSETERKSTSPNTLPSESYMIKLNIINGEVVK